MAWLRLPALWSMKLALALLFGANAQLQFDATAMLKMQAMKSKFILDSIGHTQQVGLLEHAGFSDWDLFSGGIIGATEFRKSMKQRMLDQYIESILVNGGLDISQPMYRKMFFGDLDDNKMYAEATLKEPMQSIVQAV